MRLFKYVAAEEAVSAIAAGSLKFTPIDQLNDPMEVLPFYDAAEVQKSLQLLRTNGCTTDQFQWLKHQENLLKLLAPEMMFLQVPNDISDLNQIYKLAGYQHLPFLEAMLFRTISQIRAKVGVLSLTERWDSLPMWAHYANGAKGFVIGWDGLDQLYHGDETGSLNFAKPVKYEKIYRGMTFDPRTQERLFFSKLDDWQNEREWRVVRALEQCRLTTEGFHVDDIPKAQVRTLICGWNVSDDVYRRVSDRLLRTNPDITIVKALTDHGRIRTDLELPPEQVS